MLFTYVESRKMIQMNLLTSNEYVLMTHLVLLKERMNE